MLEEEKKIIHQKYQYYGVLSRTTSGPAISQDYTDHGLVRDGTMCGNNLICMNQTCVSLFPYVDQTKCPTDGKNVECYGQGVSFRFYQSG